MADRGHLSGMDDPAAYYDEFGDGEWERLAGDLYGRLEFAETTHFLARDLPDAGRVLDVGGGAGRYACWLAERGHEVRLVDPSERQVELAREKTREHGVGASVTAAAGDVRDLDAGTGEFDATLCLGGPLSHVLDADERARAARELRRVTAAGGPVFVSVMGLLAALQTVTRFAGRVPPAEDETELLPDLARSGTYGPELLAEHDRTATAPPMHLFRVRELEALLRDAGLTVETVTGLESVCSQRRTAFGELTDAHRAAVRAAVRELREDRAAADLSGHFLAVARA